MRVLVFPREGPNDQQWSRRLAIETRRASLATLADRWTREPPGPPADIGEQLSFERLVAFSVPGPDVEDAVVRDPRLEKPVPLTVFYALAVELTWLTPAAFSEADVVPPMAVVGAGGESGAGSVDHLTLHGARARHADGHVGQGVSVGVVDSGLSHESMPDERLLSALDAGQAFDGDGERLEGDVADATARRHGTKVAALIAGARSGVAPGARLHVARILDEHCRGTLVALGAALEWLVTEQACQIINLSLTVDERYRGEADTLRRRLEANALADVLFVAAAGNNRHVVPVPGNLEHVLTVGAVHPDGAAWASSGSFAGTSYAKPDLAAVGVGVLGEDGTSLATPQVTGAAALLHGRFSEVGDALKARVLAHTRPPGVPCDKIGRGVLDLTRCP